MYWQQMISCLAEIDCLCGLSVLARNVKEKKIMPDFLNIHFSSIHIVDQTS